MLHAGDLINNENDDAEWGEWFGAGSWLNGMIPVVATPGNHEYDDDDQLSRHWRPQFAFPMNGPSGLEETVYWFDYQGARIISLNSNERIDEQRDWLKSVLSEADRPKWTIVTFHHPIYSTAGDRDNPGLRAAWQPILEESGVDLVLAGPRPLICPLRAGRSYERARRPPPQEQQHGLRRERERPENVPTPEALDVFAEKPRACNYFRLFAFRRSKSATKRGSPPASPTMALRSSKDDEGKTTLTEQIPAKAEIRE